MTWPRPACEFMNLSFSPGGAHVHSYIRCGALPVHKSIDTRVPVTGRKDGGKVADCVANGAMFPIKLDGGYPTTCCCCCLCCCLRHCVRLLPCLAVWLCILVHFISFVVCVFLLSPPSMLLAFPRSSSRGLKHPRRPGKQGKACTVKGISG